MAEVPRSTRRMGQVADEDRHLSYGSYLRIPELLGLQTPRSSPPAHDETLFIVLHQAFELWFKELVFELESIRDRMFAGDVHQARHLLSRVHAIERLLIEQIEVIETMSPQDFLQFRSNLEPASGFQSVQFREIEFLGGLKEPGFAKSAETPEERERIERRLKEPTLWDAFCILLETNGLPMPAGDEEARRSSLLKMARDREAFAELWFLSEDLLVHDELFSLWRQRHILMVERQIGTKRGTGGSSGSPYLRTTLEKRFFPELWELRSYL
ncbi:MAG TPA: tryptophan 2,3-dioxygenase family protein [Actinomycetota bacterium]|nr:tryptophan 2,3-dioxygenase family protein [Actinomycetota bacterium]